MEEKGENMYARLLEGGVYPFGYLGPDHKIDRFKMNQKENLMEMGARVCANREKEIERDMQILLTLLRRMKEEKSEVGVKETEFSDFAHITTIFENTALKGALKLKKLEEKTKKYATSNIQICHIFCNKEDGMIQTFYFMIGCWISCRIMEFIEDNTDPEETLLKEVINDFSQIIDNFLVMKFIRGGGTVVMMLEMPYVLFSEVKDKVIVPISVFILGYDFVDKNVYIQNPVVTPLGSKRKDDIITYLEEKSHISHNWQIEYNKQYVSVSDLILLTIFATHQNELFRYLIITDKKILGEGEPTVAMQGLKAFVSNSVRRTCTRIEEIKAEPDYTKAGNELVFCIPVESMVYQAKMSKLFATFNKKLPAKFWHDMIEDELLADNVTERQKIFKTLWNMVWKITEYVHYKWDALDGFKVFDMSKDGKTFKEKHSQVPPSDPASIVNKFDQEIQIRRGSIIMGSVLFPLIRRYPIFTFVDYKKALVPYIYDEPRLFKKVGEKIVSDDISTLLISKGAHSSKVLHGGIIDRMIPLDYWSYSPEFESFVDPDYVGAATKTAEASYMLKLDGFLARLYKGIGSKLVPDYSGLIDDMTCLVFENPLLFPILLSMISFTDSQRSFGLPWTGINQLKVLVRMIDSSFIGVRDKDAKVLFVLRRAFYHVFHKNPVDLFQKILNLTHDEVEKTRLIREQPLVLLYIILHSSTTAPLIVSTFYKDDVWGSSKKK